MRFTWRWTGEWEPGKPPTGPQPKRPGSNTSIGNIAPDRAGHRLVVAKGNRRLRYRGTAKNNAWLQTRLASLNLRRMLVLGLNHQDGVWALA